MNIVEYYFNFQDNSTERGDMERVVSKGGGVKLIYPF